MGYRENNRRDRIIMTYACGDVEFDSGLRRYGFFARTDDDTFNRISHMCRSENVPFTTGDFNRFIAEVNGYASTNRRLWPHTLPASSVLPGERMLVNAGYGESETDIMKLSDEEYLVVESGSSSALGPMDIVTISRDSIFATGSRVELRPGGQITVNTVEFLMPTAMNRAVDALKMRGFARKAVAGDLRGFYKAVVLSLREGRFIGEFDNILAEACQLGAGSWVVRTIVDAYSRKNYGDERD